MKTKQSGSKSITTLSAHKKASCADSDKNCNQPSPNFNFSSPLNGKIFFTGGGQTYEMVTAFENSQMISQTSENSLSGTFGVGMETEIQVPGFYFSTKVMFSGVTDSSTEKSKGKGVATSTSVGLSLGDTNIADKFNIEILVNKDFGISSCPHEPGTVAIDNPVINADLVKVSNVPPDQKAVFILKSVPEIDYGPRTYKLKVNENSGGAVLTLSGTPFTTEREITLPYGLERTLTLTIERGPIYYLYDDIQISIVSKCEDDIQEMYTDPISDSITLTAEFLQPCAPFRWADTWSLDSPEYFIVNAASKVNGDQMIEVVVENPNYPNLLWMKNPRYKQVVVEYKHVSSNTWSQAVINKNNDLATLTEADFGIAAMRIDASSWFFDGLYEIRVRSICTPVAGAGPVYNGFAGQPRLGRVDRNYPKLLGNFAEPNDGIFVPGDEISVAFNEDVDCKIDSYPFIAGITLTTIGTTLSVPKVYTTQDNPEHLQAYCHDNKIYLALGQKLPYSIVKGAKIKAYMNGVQDLAGNVLPNLVIWTFTVKNDLPVEYLSLTFSSLPTDRKLGEYMRMIDNAQKKKRSINYFEENTSIMKRMILEEDVAISLFENEFCKNISVSLGLVDLDCQMNTINRYEEKILFKFNLDISKLDNKDSIGDNIWNRKDEFNKIFNYELTKIK